MGAHVVELIQGDAREALSRLPDKTIQTCVTSPPYWGLRDYGIAGQLGLENSPDKFVAKLVEVFREVRRVLKDDGTLWLNLGDCYAQSSYGSGGGWAKARNNYSNAPAQNRSLFKDPGYRHGLKNKDLIGIPWRVAFALQADGWYLRQDIIWHKRNPMPESVTDRCTKAHEYIFLLSKSDRYYFDHEAIKEPALSPGSVHVHKAGNKTSSLAGDPRHATKPQRTVVTGSTRNRRSVWTVSTKPYRGAHFATFPPDLIEPCILAGAPVGGIVLDPFMGTGTTGYVALKHGRDFIGIELNPEYLELARARIATATDVGPACRVRKNGFPLDHAKSDECACRHTPTHSVPLPKIANVYRGQMRPNYERAVETPLGKGTAMTQSYKDLPFEELKALHREIGALLAERRDEALAQLREQVSALGFTVEDLLPKKPRRAAGGKRYRDPADPAKVWAGRGKRPKWLVELLEGGKTIEDLEEPAERATA